jgi:hypothetical protein
MPQRTPRHEAEGVILTTEDSMEATERITRLVLGVKNEHSLWIGEAKVTIYSPCSAVRVVVEAPMSVQIVRDDAKEKVA